MANLTNRNVDAALLKGPKARASTRGKSLDEEVQATLARAMEMERAECQRRLENAFAMANELAKTTGTFKKGSSFKFIRAFRDSGLRKKSKK